MAEAEIQHPRRMSADNQTVSKADISLKERFFRYFQHEITDLQQEMDRLADTSLVGGERADATDHCLAGIVRLSNEVKDAASYIPTYDQRVYAEAIKALQDRLSETRAAFEPRSKFSFKTKKNTSAVSLSDAALMAVEGRLSIPGYHSPGASSVDSSANQTPNYPSTPLNEPEKQQQERPELAPTSFPGVPAGNFSIKSPSENHSGGFAATGISSVSVDDYHKLHIMLPAAGSTSTVPVSLTSLDRCIVDMTIPTANGKPYASLTSRGIKESLLICGQVNGPAHITGIKPARATPLLSSNIRFGRIPKAYALDHDRPDHEDRWSQVEDFKWIKPEPSPNWSLLDPNDAVPEEVWAEIVPGGPGWSLEDILHAVKVVQN
ncbi:hypothetical protein PDIDSM_1520 [Penicillium digitatum]|nr:hypothetical protein PDIDSM_1520 [Penicillium digitatum]